jgi:hypothetical protein
MVTEDACDVYEVSVETAVKSFILITLLQSIKRAVLCSAFEIRSPMQFHQKPIALLTLSLLVFSI